LFIGLWNSIEEQSNDTHQQEHQEFCNNEIEIRVVAVLIGVRVESCKITHARSIPNLCLQLQTSKDKWGSPPSSHNPIVSQCSWVLKKHNKSAEHLFHSVNYRVHERLPKLRT
jgi:hypothetical protein